MNKFSKSTLAVIFSTLFVYSPLSYSQDFYEIIDLGKIDADSSQVFGFDVNENQMAVGYEVKDQTTGLSRGFFYNSDNANLIDLGAIDNREVLVEITNTVDGVETTESINVGIDTDTSSLILSINNDGLAVGLSARIFGSVLTTENTDGTFTESAASISFGRAIYIDTNTLELSEIPDFVVEAPQSMRAIAITNNYIVGTGIYDEPEDVDDDNNPITALFDRGFIYDIISAELTKISPLDNELTHHITLRDIDENGFAVGISAEKSPFGIFNKKVIGVDLSTPDDVVEYTIFDTNSAEVSAINEFKKIVGKAVETGGQYLTAYLYDINTETATDLGVLNSNFPFSDALDINNSDQIVGISQTKSQPNVFSGFIYENGEMKDLSKLIGCDTGWTIHEARSINNGGYITGTGLLNGETKAFMLKPIDGTAPVCEDDSLNLGGSGSTNLLSLISLLGLLGLGRRYLSQ